jgi:glycosyltransferase involved in cell wall biosynthesis
MTGPDATLVIPTKDRPGDLRRAVRCALAQRDVAMEVLVVDDGSAVPATTALSGVHVPAPHRLEVVRHGSPQGVAVARNHGIALATAPWVGFCDDDDMWAPTKVRDQLAVAGDDAGWTCSGTLKVDTGLVGLQVQPAPEPATVADVLLAANVVPGGASAVLARTEVVRSLGGFDTALSTLADWDFWARLARATPLAVVDRPLVAYVVHEYSMSTNTSLLADDLARFDAKHAGARTAHGITFDEGNWCRYVAEMHLRAGRRLRAARRYGMAVRHGRHSAWRLAVASLASPEWAVRRLRDRRRAHLPADWLEEAEAWLAPLRTEEADDMAEAAEAAPLALAGPALPVPPVTL